MAKLKNFNVNLGNFESLDNCYVEINLLNAPKNIKITKALLPLKVTNFTMPNDVGIEVNYSYYIGDSKYNRWKNIDFIHSLDKEKEEEICLNITDELQDALACGADSLCLDFVPSQSTINCPFIGFESDKDLNIDYISLSTYQENGASHTVDLGKAGQANIDLATGNLYISTPIIKADNNPLPFSLSMNYNSCFNLERENWGNNLQQKLICEQNDETLRFRYIDGNGKQQLIEETYYYIDEEETRHSVMRHDNDDLSSNDVFADGDGTLKIRLENGKVYDVQTELESPSGLKLVSSISDISKNLAEFEPEELLSIKQQAEQLEDNLTEIKHSLKLNQKQFCAYVLTKAMLSKQLDGQEKNVLSTEALLDLQEKVENIKMEALIRNRNFRKTNSSTDVADLKESLDINKISSEDVDALYGKIIEGTFSSDSDIVEGTIVANESSLIYTFGFKDEVQGNLESQRLTNNLNKDIYVFEIGEEEFANLMLDALSSTDLKDSFDMSELWNEFRYSLNNSNQKLTYSYKDLISIDIQLENLIHTQETYTAKLKKYTAQLEKLNYQKEQYELQLPVHYLYDESTIYGFAKASKTDANLFRLVMISDYYENVIRINYKAFDLEELSEIIDSNEKTIAFTYRKNSVEIVDTRERKTIFKFDNNSLTEVVYPDQTYAKYYYDSENNLVATIDSSGLGVLFEYEADKVTQINAFSLLDKVVDGKISFKFDNWSFSDFKDYLLDKERISIVYNDYKSTKLVNGQNKTITYMFDEYGRVRSCYENLFNEEEGSLSTKNCEFCYSKDKLNLKIKGLQNSANFLEDVNFNNASTRSVSIHSFGESANCGDITPSLFAESANFHAIEASPFTANCDVMQVSPIMLNKLKMDEEIASLVLSGWAKADSAFITSPDEEYDFEFPTFVRDRKFELRAEVTYKVDEEEKTFSYHKTFDFMNLEWQFCAVSIPLTVENDGKTYEKSAIENIDCYFDYSFNTGTASYTELELREGQWEESRFDKENNIYIQTASHSPWTKTTYINKDTNLIEKVVLSREVTSEDGTSTLQEFPTLYFYNKNNRLIKTIDHNGIVTENVYNDKGVQIKSMTYHKTEPTNVLYSESLTDEKGVTTGELNQFGEQISKTENLEGTGLLKSATDNAGNKTAYGYDINDELIEQSTTIDGTANVNTYGYALNFLTSLKHNGFEIAYNYDSQGRNNEIILAGERYLSKTFTDNEEETTLATGETFKTTYNDDGKVAKVFYQNELSYLNVYNTLGDLIYIREQSKDDDGNTHILFHRYYYDKFGNLSKMDNSQHSANDDINVSIVNNYNYQSNLDSTSITINNEILSYNYSYSDEPEPKLIGIELPNKATHTLSYDKLQRVHTLSLSDEQGSALLSKEFEYLKYGDHASNLVSKVKFSSKNSPDKSLSYKYDKMGNITQIRQNNTLLAQFQYDGLSRLVREDNFALDKTSTYTYDAGGNILERRDFPLTLSENLEFESFSPASYSYNKKGWRDQLKSYSHFETDENGSLAQVVENFEYDKLGNPTLYRDKTLQWSHGRQLDKFGDIAEYKYNAQGVRKSKKFDGFTTEFFLNGTQIIKQCDASNELTFYYGVDGVTGFHIKSLNAIFNGEPLDHDFYYQKNAQNDITAILSTDGTIIAQYEYDAFGNNFVKFCKNIYKSLDNEEISYYNDTSDINRFIAIKNPFRYRSYYYDIETKLYYLNSRYYDPELGRFINADSINTLNITQLALGGLNLYSYCSNNPVNLSDLLGNLSTKNRPFTFSQDISNSNNSRKHHISFELEYSWELFDGWVKYLFVNIKFTKSVKSAPTTPIYSFSSASINGVRFGVGVDFNEQFGASIYYGTDISVGIQFQISSLHFGESIGLDGIGFNIGLDFGNNSYDFSFTVSWTTLAAAAALAATPIPGSRLVALLLLLLDCIF